MTATIAKELSPNDAGETASHQAGMLIPKDARLLDFFPKLDPSVLNPRVHLEFEDVTGSKWEFAFIYYNNRLFGKTRNEYRLTRMTRYIRKYELESGDEVRMTRNDVGLYQISHQKQKQTSSSQDNFLILGSGWKIVNLS